MILFVGDACPKCKTLKETFDLENLGIQVESISGADGLGLAAWHGVMTVPALVVSGETIIDYEEIQRRLQEKKGIRSS